MDVDFKDRWIGSNTDHLVRLGYVTSEVVTHLWEDMDTPA